MSKKQTIRQQGYRHRDMIERRVDTSEEGEVRFRGMGELNAACTAWLAARGLISDTPTPLYSYRKERKQ